MRNEFTAIVEQDGPWYIAYCAEVPGANGQGKSREECLTNLRDGIALIDRGIAFNGVILISATLNLETIWSRSDDLVYELELPTYAADAWYHKKVAADLQKKDLRAFLKEVEGFAMGEYSTALNKGDALTPDERKQTIDKLARYTGLEPRFIDNCDLRFDVGQFTRELLRDKRLTIGRLDGRLTGPSPLNPGERSEFDPSNTLIRPPFQATFMNYVRGELGYKTDMVYYVSGGIMPWDYGHITESPWKTRALNDWSP